MIKVNRTENPTFEKYNDKVVQDSLKKDFHKKCYLCEEVTRHFEVEHFFPQLSHKDLINKYSNLFYSCEKCNKLKPKKVNTIENEEILNCCDVDVEKYIKLALNIDECKIDIFQIKNDEKLELKIENTIKLLERIYNGKNSKSNSCEDLQQDIIDEIEIFRKIIDKYNNTRLKNSALNEIKEKLDLKSSYSTFKRWLIKDNESLNKQFYQYIILNEEV